MYSASHAMNCVAGHGCVSVQGNFLRLTICFLEITAYDFPWSVKAESRQAHLAL